MDYDGLFEFLFIDPLRNEKEKYLLIIDGLDELEESTGLSPLIKLLRQYASRINPNISILVTGRPEENIVNKLRTVNGNIQSQSVILDKVNGSEDISEFIRKNLDALGCFSEGLLEKISEACDGNFEYLTLLFKEVTEEGLELSEKFYNEINSSLQNSNSFSTLVVDEVMTTDNVYYLTLSLNSFDSSKRIIFSLLNSQTGQKVIIENLTLTKQEFYFIFKPESEYDMIQLESTEGDNDISTLLNISDIRLYLINNLLEYNAKAIVKLTLQSKSQLLISLDGNGIKLNREGLFELPKDMMVYHFGLIPTIFDSSYVANFTFVK